MAAQARFTVFYHPAPHGCRPPVAALICVVNKFKASLPFEEQRNILAEAAFWAVLGVSVDSPQRCGTGLYNPSKTPCGN